MPTAQKKQRKTRRPCQCHDDTPCKGYKVFIAKGIIQQRSCYNVSFTLCVINESMSISRLTMQGFRHLQSINLCPHPTLNIIYGENASGKTSLLEALYFLSRARSFRTKQLEHLIAHDAPGFTLFAALKEPQQKDSSIGVSRARNGDARLKVNGKRVYSSSESAKSLPIILFNQDSFLLLSGGSKPRRALLDWGLFHQDEAFLSLWQKAHKIIKQRNALLKMKSTESLQHWDQSLVLYAEQLNEYRQRYVEAFIKKIQMVMPDFLPNKSIRMQFYPGWPKDKTLTEALAAAQKQDFIRGYSQYGPHRADLRITVDGLPVEEALSRGQQKVFICALKITQGLLFDVQHRQPCIYLIDDISAELDGPNHKRLMARLEKLNAQVFITSILPTNVVKYVDQSSMALFSLDAGCLHERTSCIGDETATST